MLLKICPIFFQLLLVSQMKFYYQLIYNLSFFFKFVSYGDVSANLKKKKMKVYILSISENDEVDRIIIIIYFNECIKRITKRDTYLKF